MALPSDANLRLELERLSLLLYDCIGEAGTLGPSYNEYDHHRDRRWSSSRAMLVIYGLAPNRIGWEQLLNSFGLLAPSSSHSRQASAIRRQAKARKLELAEEEYPELVGKWVDYGSFAVFQIR